MLAANREDYDEAQRLWQEALELEVKSEIASGEGVTVELGTMALERGDEDEAEKMLRLNVLI